MLNSLLQKESRAIARDTGYFDMDLLHCTNLLTVFKLNVFNRPRTSASRHT